MSEVQMQEITCPKCGKKHSFSVWDSINVMEHPDMREKVRNDEASRFQCPDCGASALLNYNFLYHDPEEKIFIFCNTEQTACDEIRRVLTDENNAFKNYTKRIVPSYNAFKEKLMIFDARLDDKLVEIMKSGIFANLEAHYKDKNIDEVLFAVNEDGEKGFIMRSNGVMQAGMEFDESLYNALKEKAEETVALFSPTDVEIDTAWAREIIERL